MLSRVDLEKSFITLRPDRTFACLITLLLLHKHKWRRMTLRGCNLFDKSIFVGLNFELFFLHHI